MFVAYGGSAPALFDAVAYPVGDFFEFELFGCVGVVFLGLFVFVCHGYLMSGGLRQLLGAWLCSTPKRTSLSSYSLTMWTQGSSPSPNSSSSSIVMGIPSWVLQTAGPHHPLSIPIAIHWL